MADRWVCTACGEPAGEPADKLLSGEYGSQRCLSAACKGHKRVFQKEVNRDTPGRLHDAGGERPPTP